jgi:biopolymer transport protein TolQ
MSADLSIINLIMHASLVVQFVIVLLLLASIWSWAIIFAKSHSLKRARLHAISFEERFWSGGDLTTLYTQISGQQRRLGLEGIFEAGFREFVRLRKQKGIEPMAVVEGAQRAMRVVLNRELEKLEQHLSFLASVGSTSPYIGLFGTVWGIMHAFKELGNAQQATLASVAPGIAEALVATAIGLFAAIPAVMAYNSFASYVERQLNRYDNFLEEFSTVLQRQAHV